MRNTGMYYIMDANGTYYRTGEKKQLVAAKSREEAEIFDLRTANEQIGGGTKARTYYTIPVDEQEPLPDAFYDKGCVKQYDMEKIDWMSYMQYFSYLLKNAPARINALNGKLSDVDKEICDLLHYIEFYDLSEEESMDVAARIKDSRLRRRRIKDELVKVEVFKKELGTDSNQQKAEYVIAQIRKLSDRLYHPRQLPEIFIGMSGRETDRNVYWMEMRKDTVQYENDEEEIKMEQRDTVFDKEPHDWLAFARQQREFYDNVLPYKNNLKLAMKEIEEKIEEILYMIEDANLNVTQGYKVFKQLKQLRNEKKEKQLEYECLMALTKGMKVEDRAEQAEEAVQDIENLLDVEMPEEKEEVQEGHASEEFTEVSEEELEELDLAADF